MDSLESFSGVAVPCEIDTVYIYRFGRFIKRLYTGHLCVRNCGLKKDSVQNVTTSTTTSYLHQTDYIYCIFV